MHMQRLLRLYLGMLEFEAKGAIVCDQFQKKFTGILVIIFITNLKEQHNNSFDNIGRKLKMIMKQNYFHLLMNILK